MKNYIKPKKECVKFSEIQSLENNELALLLSGLLDNPNLPPQIVDGLTSGLANLYDDIQHNQNSPEFIGQMLNAYQKDLS